MNVKQAIDQLIDIYKKHGDIRIVTHSKLQDNAICFQVLKDSRPKFKNKYVVHLE